MFSTSLVARLITSPLAYTESQGHLRRFLEAEYSHTFGRFMGLLKNATPELSAVERYWRNHFMLGATAFALSSSDALTEILWNKLGVETPIEEIVDQLVPVLAAGIQAHTVVHGNVGESGRSA